MAEADRFQAQARHAWQAGQAALVGGDLVQAIQWLERAHRIAPEDAATTLSLAAAHLRSGAPALAEALLAEVTQRHDSREALLLLATARLRLGLADAAAAALGTVLSRHLLGPDAALAALADGIVQASGAPGWCAVSVDGRLRLMRHATGALALTLDGQPVAPRGTLRVPDSARDLVVTIGGRPCLGSPLVPAVARRTEGVVSALDGGLEGWAWHPGDPDTDPRLAVRGARGGTVAVIASDLDMLAAQALARPRRFHVPAERIAHLAPPLRVTGRDGADLAGSPLDPTAEIGAAAAIARALARRHALRPGRPHQGDAALCQAAVPAALRGPPARAPAAPARPVAVVLPVHGGLDLTRRCLDSVFATLPVAATVVVVDDASPEPALVALLDGLRAAGRIRLLRHAANRGFPAAANAGLRAATRLPGNPDVVLLNSDTLVTAGWIEGLRAAVHAQPDIGTATPLSNDATILSYPTPTRATPAPATAELARLGRQAARANPGVAVEIPTAVGFCMYIRRECLREVGLFREDVFAQGYGEENDLCLRARHLGWRHVAVPGVFVAHLGGQSFGTARAPLVARNHVVLERLHPGYGALIAAFIATDPLAPARRRLDLARWRAARHRSDAGAVILVTHDSGGGVERVVRDRCAAIRAAGQRPILLRPVRDRAPAGQAYQRNLCRVDDGDDGFPNLVFAVPQDLPALAALLRADRPVALEVHHLLGHTHAVLRLAELLAIPTDMHIHDYAWFCPRVVLVGADKRYCGEPTDARICEACVADAGRAIEDDIPVAALRARSARDLAAARRVVVPSADAAARLRRQFAGLAPEVVAHEAEPPLARRTPRPAGGRRRVCVIGGIGPEKGYDLLLGCARDAVLRGLPLEFVLVGHTTDDRRLLDTGRVFVTGAYREGESEALIRAHAPDLAWLPSLLPETWSFTLGEAWRAGLRVAVFDIGAQAERVRATGHGWVLPLALSVGALNNALLAVEP